MILWAGVENRGYCVAIVRGPSPAELLDRLGAKLIAEATLDLPALLDEAESRKRVCLVGVAEIPQYFWEDGREWAFTFEPDSAVIPTKAGRLAVHGVEVYGVVYRPGVKYQFVWALERKIRIRINLLTSELMEGAPHLIAALQEPSEALDFEAAAAPYLREGMRAAGVDLGSNRAAPESAG